jgi:hypothetical protein
MIKHETTSKPELSAAYSNLCTTFALLLHFLEAVDVEFGTIKFQITAQFPEPRTDLPLLALANVNSAIIFPHGCIIW